MPRTKVPVLDNTLPEDCTESQHRLFTDFDDALEMAHAKSPAIKIGSGPTLDIIVAFLFAIEDASLTVADLRERFVLQGKPNSWTPDIGPTVGRTDTDYDRR